MHHIIKEKVKQKLINLTNSRQFNTINNRSQLITITIIVDKIKTLHNTWIRHDNTALQQF